MRRAVEQSIGADEVRVSELPRPSLPDRVYEGPSRYRRQWTLADGVGARPLGGSLRVSRRVARLLPLVLALHASADLAHGEGQSAEAQTRAYMEKRWRSGATPGGAVAVVKHGKLVFSDGVGYADLDNLIPTTASTVFNIGSVSKVVTAVAVMQLMEHEKVSLDDPIQKYVPAFPDKGSPITIRHIMTHTSGIRHYRPTDFPDSEDNENVKPTSLAEGIRVFKDDPLLFKPGEYYFYSSYAVNLLQAVVEKAAGMGFEEYLRRAVWSPAGMLSTCFDIPARIVPHRARGYETKDGETTNWPYGNVTYKFASGGMLSTAEDLVRFATALNNGTLLKPETKALMYKPVEPLMQFQEQGPPKKTWTDRQQALMWRILKDAAGRSLPYHCGTVKGQGACLVNYPSEDLAVAITFNAYGPFGGYEAAETIADFFLAEAN